MGKKVKLSSLLIKPREYWPSCTQNPRTVSFRVDDDNIFKTLNSVYFDPLSHLVDGAESTPDSWFSHQYNTEYHDSDVVNGGGEANPPDPVEAVIRGARRGNSTTTRLFFDPEETSSMSSSLMVLDLEEKNNQQEEKEKQTAILADKYSPFKESVVMSMESEDPYLDFKMSMEDMVLTHGMIKDWASLEDLLCWYLRVNAKDNHAYILGAFVDLLANNTNYTKPAPALHNHHPDNNPNRISTSTTFSSAASSFCSSSSTSSCFHYHHQPPDTTITIP